jgi:hypothetical protein
MMQLAKSKLNGVIGGSDIKKRNLYNNGHPRKRYMEEFTEYAKQTYVNESDCDSNKNFMIQGTSTINGAH